MNKLIPALLLGAAVAAPAHAVPFIGPGSPGPLAVSVTGNLAINAGGGSATVGTDSVVLIGGDQDPAGCTGGVYQVHGPCQIQAVYTAPGVYSFNWTYNTTDTAGPGGDQFGVLVDGVAFTLSDPGGAVAQGGSRQYAASTSFGWFLNCTDCTSGAAQATITALAIPEPATWLLMLTGGAVFATRTRRATRASN